MSVWEEIARYKLPVVYLHQHSGQPESCLEGLILYAVQIARNKHTYAFRTPYQIITWLWQQAVKLDHGDGPTVSGCFPAQRSRIWPDDGLNCWEAVAHLLAVAFVYQWMIEFHIYDARVGTQRHVFPAIRPLYGYNDFPVPLVIQPPVSTGKSGISLRAVAQGWENDLLGGIHIVGDKVLRVFGLGDLSDQISTLEGDALPDWARTAKQREQRAAEQIKQAIAQTSKFKPTDEKGSSTGSTTAQMDTEVLKKRVEQLLMENTALKAKLTKGA